MIVIASMLFGGLLGYSYCRTSKRPVVGTIMFNAGDAKQDYISIQFEKDLDTILKADELVFRRLTSGENGSD